MSDKIRPKDHTQLIAALEQDALDRRTSQAKQIAEVKQHLAGDFHNTTRAILRHEVATNLAIEKMILDRLFTDQEKIVQGNQLSPLITEDLIRLRTQTRKALLALSQFEGRKKGKSANPYAGAVLELSDGGEQ
jgi:hypothetical protein